VPLENIILVGQSCGGWGSLQAAAFVYPGVGGVLAFAPTCHGQLPHSSAVKRARESEIAQLAERVRFPGAIFLYEGDSYYDLADWEGFETRGQRAPDLKLERLARGRVLEVCSRCGRDSHGAMSDARFGAAFFPSHVQPLIDRVRERIRARAER
jgi:dienelactone hydrolase